MKKYTLSKSGTSSLSGFTIIELLVTVAVMAVLVMVAIPSFTDTIKNNRLITKSNDLVAAISVARQTAINRSLVTMVCHSNNAESASPSCNGGTASNWSTGSLIYTPPLRTIVASERVYASGSDSLIQSTALDDDDGITVTEATNADYISFTSQGLLYSFNEIELKVCDDRVGESGRIVRVSRAGRISTKEALGVDACA